MKLFTAIFPVAVVFFLLTTLIVVALRKNPRSDSQSRNRS